ncbi:hypothetical protein, conserved [Leishmania tarentolae]|uniref:Bacterial transcriptional activator domain-containing protein n=1 Tax=Leishmania tarentolae TaxID=5689 RepID=A0A640K8P5_LEITA|nr:hypothetical protein, conserved [Leishmania tarentolae]
MSSTPPPPPPPSSTSAVYSRTSTYEASDLLVPSFTDASPSDHRRRGGGKTRVRVHTHGSSHADPATSRAATAPSASCTSTPHADPDVGTPPPPSAASLPLPSISSDILTSLEASVQESLAGYLYTDAIELAQRLFDVDASYAHLHLLAHCYVVSGESSTAYRLLQHYYPFLELHVTRPRTAGASTSASSGAVGVGSGSLPFDARRTWSTPYGVHHSQHASLLGMSASEEAAAFAASSDENNLTANEFELGYETVDLQSQWDCQYLLGVCCYRTQHYEDGAKVLSQLLHMSHQVTTASSALRQRLQQLWQQQQQVAMRSDTSEEDDAGVAAAVHATERQLRAHAFVTEARTSQVLYWLGLCEKHRQRHPIAAEHLRRAYMAYPLRIDAFQEYVHLAWPSEQVVQSLLTVKESLIEEEDGADVDITGSPPQRQRPVRRHGRDVTDVAVAVDADVHDEEQRDPRSAASMAPRFAQPVRRGVSTVALPAPRLTAQQRRCVQQHLQPFLHAAFLNITYRCPEAVEAFQALLAQEQQHQRAAAVALRSAPFFRMGGLHASERAGAMRSPSSSWAPLWKSQGGGSAATAVVASATSPWLLCQLALAHFHNGDIQESADTFARLLHTAPWALTHPALVFYSTALWHLKSESALGSLAQRLTDAEPLRATTLCVVANAYSLIKDPRDALVMLKRAVQMAPTLAYAHALHGYELLGQDSKAEAEAAFKAALAVDASLYIAYAGLGERFMREEQIDKARGYYEKAVRLNPTPAIINRLALTYHRQGKSLADLKTARRLYTEALERHPNNITARRQRADVLLRLDQPAQALEELKALLAQCPGEAVVYVALAECMVCLRRPHEALQHYQTAMHLDPRRESYVQGCIDQLVAANIL